MYCLLVAFFTFVSAPFVLAQRPTTLAYDNNYDNGNLSTNDVACSGILSRNYSTLGSLPAFPNLGGVYTVTGYDAPQCGACYAVTYGNTTVNILAVDASKTGFTVSETAMNNLTGNQAVALGRVNVTFVEVNAAVCGM